MSVSELPVERWIAPPSPPHPRDFMVAAAVAVLLHLALFLSVGGFDTLERRQVTAAEEIPVELVDKVPDQPPTTAATSDQASQAAGKQEPSAGSEASPRDQRSSAGETAEAAAKAETANRQAAETERPEPAQRPADAAPEKASQPAMQQPSQASTPQAARPQNPPPPAAQTGAQPAQQQPSTVQTPPVLVPALKDEGEPPQGPREPPPPPPSGPESTVPDEPAIPSEQDAATAEFRFVPKGFRVAAAPAADKSTDENYKGLVFGLLEQSKRIPPAAEARGASGAAVISFMLDRAGNVVTLTLVKPTGDRDLDAEAMALVRRASPFPKPPPGVLLTFAPLIVFGQEPVSAEH